MINPAQAVNYAMARLLLQNDVPDPQLEAVICYDRPDLEGDQPHASDLAPIDVFETRPASYRFKNWNVGRDEKVARAVRYHFGSGGEKWSTTSNRPLDDPRQLSDAYSPWVGPGAVEIINRHPQLKPLMAPAPVVIASNGKAVLGYGGEVKHAKAFAPVGDGKAAICRKFANLSAATRIYKQGTPKEDIVRALLAEEGNSAIMLEDIAAPDCYYIEKELTERAGIPVMHDDQHGTAMVSLAGLINSLRVTGRVAMNATRDEIRAALGEVKVVVSGAGSSAIATANLFVKNGVQPHHVFMLDTGGLLYRDREDYHGLNAEKHEYARGPRALEKYGFDRVWDGRKNLHRISLEDVMAKVRPDVFVGLSGKDAFRDKSIIRLMAEKPIIFAMANPDPEITPDELRELGIVGAVVATGRSDYPNQVNNALVYPFLFRAVVIEAQATRITDTMKAAAAYTLADLALEEVPPGVVRAYRLEQLAFGADYIIPKQIDPRLRVEVTMAVIEQAFRDGVTRYEFKSEAQKLRFLKLVRDKLRDEAGMISATEAQMLGADYEREFGYTGFGTVAQWREAA